MSDAPATPAATPAPCCKWSTKPWNVGKVHLLHTPTPGALGPETAPHAPPAATCPHENCACRILDAPPPRTEARLSDEEFERLVQTCFGNSAEDNRFVNEARRAREVETQSMRHTMAHPHAIRNCPVCTQIESLVARADRAEKELALASIVECVACGHESERDSRSWICETCAATAGERACKAEAEREAIFNAVCLTDDPRRLCLEGGGMVPPISPEKIGSLIRSRDEARADAARLARIIEDARCAILCLVPNPDEPDWSLALPNPADRVCLQDAVNALAAAKGGE